MKVFHQTDVPTPVIFVTWIKLSYGRLRNSIANMVSLSPNWTSIRNKIASGLLWGLQGDAAQRAIIAWNMGWLPTREAPVPLG